MPKSEYAVLAQAEEALRYLARPRSRTQLAEHLEIDGSTAHRFLRALSALGWVKQAHEEKRRGVGRRAVTYVAVVSLSKRKR